MWLHNINHHVLTPKQLRLGVYGIEKNNIKNDVWCLKKNQNAPNYFNEGNLQVIDV